MRLKKFYGLATTLLVVLFLDSSAHAQVRGNVTAVWVNDGGDKVTQDELRASNNPDAVINRVWDGTKVNLFGAGNEVVSFNLILEAQATEATNVTTETEYLLYLEDEPPDSRLPMMEMWARWIKNMIWTNGKKRVRNWRI